MWVGIHYLDLFKQYNATLEPHALHLQTGPGSLLLSLTESFRVGVTCQILHAWSNLEGMLYVSTNDNSVTPTMVTQITSVYVNCMGDYKGQAFTCLTNKPLLCGQLSITAQASA